MPYKDPEKERNAKREWSKKNWKSYDLDNKRQLGMPFGTASARLKKMVLFHLAVKLGMDICFRCNTKIENIDDFTLEHKIPWRHNNIKLFWDMENIAFSHEKCNFSEKRHTRTTNNKYLYKGIFKEFGKKNHIKPWRANISINRKTVKLGSFSTQEEAAIAYDKAAIETFGERAITNKDLGLLH